MATVHILLVWSLIFVTPQGKEIHEWRKVGSFTQTANEGSLAQCLKMAHKLERDTRKFKCERL